MKRCAQVRAPRRVVSQNLLKKTPRVLMTHTDKAKPSKTQWLGAFVEGGRGSVRIVFKCILSRAVHVRRVCSASAKSGATNPRLCNAVRALCVRARVVRVLCFAPRGDESGCSGTSRSECE